MKNLKFNLFIITTIVLAVISWLVYSYFIKNKNVIHIAFVGGLSGENALNGQSLLEGIKLYIDGVNQKGGVNGRKIMIDIYDDQNDAELAREKALEIVKAQRAVAVIGHWYSSCSLKGGEIYNHYHIPAISPTSTNVKVTENNPWYFRTIFDDNLQGRFLANYVKKVFRPQAVTIIHSDRPYGVYLAQVFENSAINLNMPVKYQWGFVKDDPKLSEKLLEIVKNLKQVAQEAGVIFLATHASEGIKIIKLIKDYNINNVVIVPDSFASKTFQEGFNDFPKEKTNPGYYTRDVYVTTPIIFDSAGEKAHQFKQQYLTQYHTEPGWRAAFSYDAAMVIVEAIKKMEIKGRSATLEQDRQKIRDYLAGIDNRENAIKGVTGLNYFDDNGDVQKPISIGVYKNQNIISALTQIQDIPYLSTISNLDDALEQERVLLIDGKYMYKTNVVYTGVRINEISQLNLKDLTYTLDFNLWFRYQGDIQPQDIKFYNAAAPIKIEPPLVQETINQINYRLYRIKGRFKTDFLPNHHAFKQHLLGISFRHQELNRHNLIYVIDVVGMGLSQHDVLLRKMQQNKILSPNTGWMLEQIWFFQDIVNENSFGNPHYLGRQSGAIDYSRFNAAMLIKPDEFTFSGMIPHQLMNWLIVLSVIALILLVMMSAQPLFKPLYKSIIILQIFFTLLLLLSSEMVSLEWLLAEKASPFVLDTVVQLFKILWWVIPAILLDFAAERFIWTPIEIRTERKVPNIVRAFLSLMIYILTFFGIVAFVFDQQITSLLATSGVIAMIIGLAIQVNISNIFSGIALNLERPFRVGDWVQIGKFEEGKVVNITWRTTQIKTRNGCILNIPNSTASESTIHNFNYPDDIVEEWIFVHIDATYQPELIEEILLTAVQKSQNVLEEPRPFTRLRDVNEWSAEYTVGYYIKEYAIKFRIRREIWNNILSHLEKFGITPAIEQSEIYWFEEN
jgi:branched-chain amino acid transport system substrate-binding protein